jgi:hypothetical protein
MPEVASIYAAMHAAGELGRWPDHTLIPFDGAVSRAVLDEATACLVLVRGGDLHDPGASISTLVTLIGDAEARLPDLVADARDGGYTSDRIAERLGSTVRAARHRYAEYARWRRLRRFD